MIRPLMIFLHSSFVVTEQQKHIIKVELGSKKRNKEADGNKEEVTNQKFRCPKFYATVRYEKLLNSNFNIILLLQSHHIKSCF